MLIAAETMSAMNEPAGGVEVLQVLEQERASIVDAAAESVGHSRTRYVSAGREETRRRLEALYDQLLGALSSRDLGPIVGFAERLAAERFESGYDLSEVQSAFNALEEATWTVLCARVQPEQLALSLGLVSTVLGAAKDALGREYVSLASQTHAPSLDLRALFTGYAGA
jgi:RsbRD-like negative regulator of sigma factor